MEPETEKKGAKKKKEEETGPGLFDDEIVDSSDEESDSDETVVSQTQADPDLSNFSLWFIEGNRRGKADLFTEAIAARARGEIPKVPSKQDLSIQIGMTRMR